MGAGAEAWDLGHASGWWWGGVQFMGGVGWELLVDSWGLHPGVAGACL